MKQLILLLIAGLVAPYAVLADQGLWNDAIGGTGRLGNSAKNCHPSENSSNTCYFNVSQADSDTLVTPILANMGKCENFSYAWTGDITDRTEKTNKIKGFELFCDTIDAGDECAVLIRNAELDGDPNTVTDTSAVRGVDAGRVYFRATMGAAATTGRLRISCWPK